jgi:hypothetical protein
VQSAVSRSIGIPGVKQASGFQRQDFWHTTLPSFALQT